MTTIPKKLKKDAIVEAICEIRFESTEMPEIVVGTISTLPSLKTFSKKRLPIADIPTPIRLSDPNLKYQAFIEIGAPDNQEIIKIGGNSVSIHLSTPYPGWDVFLKKMDQHFSPLFTALANFTVTRVGLRYLNALTEADHHISSIDDLKLQIKVANDPIGPKFNLNFKKNQGVDYNAMIRVASMDFVAGKIPDNAVAFIDIDISTPEEFSATSFDNIKNWLGSAHNFEKKNFFELLGDEVVNKIKEA